ncbi:MAG: PAS domain-containing protein [Ferrovibrio sp.]|uniref:PAS domain-containing protein n=1 Tax=Ferrovibrio sp. TaxID=1917215 RepID=UPI002633525E|nr:PAS domain-containing protein [Ferrovibrio sp.]MCW0234532.1 PAS domain-containing protein [Ferrovibrio sp.]
MKLDQPALQQLQVYWDKKRAGRPYPERADIDPLELRFIIGSLILVDVEPMPLRFRYRLFGTDIAQRQGFDMTGKYLDQHPWPELAAQARKTYIEVIDSGNPALIRRHGLINDQYVDHQSLILPLGGSRVEMLMAGVVFTPTGQDP